jgi:hypothetical protein
MKITSQDSNQMTLRDGSIAFGAFIGILFVAACGYGAYYLLSTPGQVARNVWIPGVIGLVGLIMIFASSSISVVIDKSQGQIAFERKRILGTSKQAENIGDAVHVELRRGSRYAPSDRPEFSVGVSNQVLQSQTVIVFKDGTEMPLENLKSRSGGSNLFSAGVMMAGEGKELSISRLAADFIGVPFEEIGEGIGRIPQGGIEM